MADLAPDLGLARAWHAANSQAMVWCAAGVVGNSFYVDFGALVDAIAEGRGDTRVVALSELSDGQASSLARALATDACVVDTLTLYSSPLSAATIRYVWVRG